MALNLYKLVLLFSTNKNEFMFLTDVKLYQMFSLYNVLRFIIILVIFNFCVEGGTLVLIASVPGYCISFTCYEYYSIFIGWYRQDICIV